MARLKYWQAINSALAEELERDDTVHLIGQDVGRAGGPFGASAKLQERFGEARVRDTPISEATIVGAGVGASMTGLRPVVEVMFLDFMTLAMDQLVNQAAKISYMSGGKFHVPLVVRSMCGAGRGTGPQHGQGLEAWLCHVPGLKVVWGSTPADVKGLLKSAIRDDDPVVAIESLSLWGLKGEVPDDVDHVVPLGVADVKRRGTDVTIVSWGAAVHRALAAAEQLAEEGIEAEVLDLRSLSPLDRSAILESVHRTGHVVIVQDAVAPNSVGSEVAALVAEHALPALRAPVARVAPPFAPVPFPPEAETAYFPQVEGVTAAVRKALEEAA